jgi:hypothetical protein
MHTINCKRIQEQEKKMEQGKPVQTQIKEQLNQIKENPKQMKEQLNQIKEHSRQIKEQLDQIKENPKQVILTECEKCGLKIPLNEIKDHLEAHKLQEEDNNSNDTNDNSLNNNQIRSRHDSSNMDEVLQEEGPQTTVETFENNGVKKVIKTMKDPSGRIISRSETISSGNNANFGSNFLFRRNPFSNITSSFSRNFFNDENDNNFNMNFRPSFLQRFPFGINNEFENFFSNIGSYNHHEEHGLDKNILNALPEVPIENVDKMDDDKKNCVICLNDFKNGEKALILPCIHLFHKDCIISWLKQNDKCPICKKDIKEDLKN